MNIMKMMQQAGQVKAKMQAMQKRVQEMEVTGEAGNGMVTITLDGAFRPRQVKINKAAVNPSDVELLEDLVKAALSDAHAKSSAMVEGETRKVMTELGLPANMDLPF